MPAGFAEVPTCVGFDSDVRFFAPGEAKAHAGMEGSLFFFTHHGSILLDTGSSVVRSVCS